MGKCKLYLGVAVMGEVNWHTEGNRVHIYARCPFEEGYIYRVTLRTETFSLPLGVMMPHGLNFQVERAFPPDKCSPLWQGIELRGEIYRTLPGEEVAEVLPFPFSRLTLAGGHRISPHDELLNHAVAQERGTLYHCHEGTTYFVFPLGDDRPSPFVPFFCLTTVMEGSSGRYGVFCMNQKGILCPL